MRLRPSGGEGELTPTLGHILEYFDARAEVWERQSFLRTRPVAGDLVLARRALERIAPRLFADLPSRTIAGRMADARARLEEKAVRGAGRVDLKLGSGGILEVLFVVQFLQLTTRDPRITTGDPLALLTTFRRIGVLDEESYRWLHSGYRFLRNLEHNIQLITGRRSADISLSGPVMQELAVAVDCGTSEKLLARLAEYRHEIRRTYEATLH
jgi:glutamate-ammonia-ligase adenylyltransferase